MLIGVRLRGFFGVVSRMQMVAMRDMGMMSALFMRSFFVMPGRLLVMAGGVLVMFSGLLMMFRSFMLRHFGFSIFLIANLTVQNKRFQNDPCQLTNRSKQWPTWLPAVCCFRHDATALRI
jgi:hypothetical protein